MAGYGIEDAVNNFFTVYFKAKQFNEDQRQFNQRQNEDRRQFNLLMDYRENQDFIDIGEGDIYNQAGVPTGRILKTTVDDFMRQQEGEDPPLTYGQFLNTYNKLRDKDKSAFAEKFKKFGYSPAEFEGGGVSPPKWFDNARESVLELDQLKADIKGDYELLEGQENDEISAFDPDVAKNRAKLSTQDAKYINRMKFVNKLIESNLFKDELSPLKRKLSSSKAKAKEQIKEIKERYNKGSLPISQEQLEGIELWYRTKFGEYPYDR